MITAAPGPTEKRITIGIRYANAGTICIASSTGVMARSKRSERPGEMPSGIPTTSESPTAENISASVWMLSSQSPLSANIANAASAQIAARTPPKRSDDERRRRRCADPGHPVQEARQPGDEVVEEVAKPLNARKTALGLSALRWSMSHVWKSFRWVGSAFQSSLPATGTPP